MHFPKLCFARLRLDAEPRPDYGRETEFRRVRSQTEFGNETLEVTIALIALLPVIWTSLGFLI